MNKHFLGSRKHYQIVNQHTWPDCNRFFTTLRQAGISIRELCLNKMSLSSSWFARAEIHTAILWQLYILAEFFLGIMPVLECVQSEVNLTPAKLSPGYLQGCVKFQRTVLWNIQYRSGFFNLTSLLKRTEQFISYLCK